MKLRKIELAGFKSFVDRTRIEIPEGFAVIVGPNGCGKSNIVDAVRWALGDQSAKTLRAKQMTDVLFAGTSKRKKSQYAEVILYFEADKDEKMLDYNQVTIARRLHRSGESEYFLNGKSVRRKDVQSLFLDSGLGKNPFAIVGQGKVESMLTMSNEQLLLMIKETAGTLRFEERKLDSIKKCEQTSQNLKLLSKLRDELEKRATQLKKQSEQAGIYKKSQTELQELQKGVLASRYFEAEEKKKGLEEKLAGVDADHEKAQVKQRGYERELDELSQVYEQSSKLTQTHRDELQELIRKKQLSESERRHAQERVEESKEKEASCKAELGRAQKELENLQKAQGKNQGHLGKLQEELKQCQAAAAERKQRWWDLNKKKKSFEERERSLHQEELKAHKDLSAAREQHQNSKIQQEHSLRQIEEIKESAQAAKTNSEKLQKELKAFDQEVAALKGEEQKLRTAYDKARSAQNSEETKGFDLQAKYSDLKTQKAEVSARKEVLLRLSEESQGISQGTAQLLKEAKDSKSPFYKKLRLLVDCLEIQEGDLRVESLKAYDSTLVVEDSSVFEQVVSYCQKQKLKGFSLFLAPKRAGKDYNLLAEIKEAKDLKQAVASKAYGQVLQLPGLKAPFWQDGRGVWFCGEQKDSNPISRKQSLAKLETELIQLDKACQKAEQDLEKQKKEVEKARAYASEMDQKLRHFEVRFVERNGLRSQMEGKLQAISDDLKLAAEKEQRLLERVKELEATLKQAERSLKELSKREEEVKKNFEALQKESQTLSKQVEQAQNEHYRQEAVLKDCNTQVAKHETELKVAAAQVQQLQIQMERLETQQKEWKAVQEESGRRIAENKELIKNFELQEKRFQTLIKEAETELVAHSKQLETHKKQEKEFRKQLDSAQSKRADLGAALAHVNAVQGEVQKEAKAQFDIELNNEVEKPKESRQDLEKAIEKLKKVLEGLGDVNMAAQGEYEECQERFVSLEQQIVDLKVTQSELMEVIDKLGERAAEQFEKTFVTVQEAFTRNFTTLFNGGQATLKVESAKEVEEGSLSKEGIQIYACPPGKKMRSLSLLSGGEKCLTAIALLFALFEAKPSPFCLLDELDAPLDETNVSRFVKLLKSYIEKTQFLVISHNKSTMAQADTLLGVSMEEQGVTTVISLPIGQHGQARKEDQSAQEDQEKEEQLTQV